MSTKTIWVLVADGARANIFVCEGAGKGQRLRPAFDYEFASAGRAQTHDQGADQPGRTYDSAGGGRHAYDDTDWQQQSKDRFARDVAGELNRAAERRAFDHLVLVAPPQTLGTLRNHLEKQARDCVTAEVTKDLTHLSPHDLGRHLKSSLPN